MGSQFTFYDYVDDQDVNMIYEWLHGDGARSRATFNQWIANAEAAPPGSGLWSPPFWSPMKGRAWKDLYEMRKTGSIQFRLIACRGPGDRAITVLAGGWHKGKIYTPHNLAQLAQDRKTAVFDNPNAHREAHRV